MIFIYHLEFIILKFYKIIHFKVENKTIIEDKNEIMIEDKTETDNSIIT